MMVFGDNAVAPGQSHILAVELEDPALALEADVLDSQPRYGVPLDRIGKVFRQFPLSSFESQVPSSGD